MKINFKGLISEFEDLKRLVPHSETNYATHYIHKYPAKFLPHFPRLFIRYFTGNNGDVVLDPMCGSGTTLIESCLADKKCLGIEIDPIGYLISKVATTPLSKYKVIKKFKIFLSELIKKFKFGLQRKIEVPSDEEFPNCLLWFRKDVLQDLILIRNEILKINDENFRNLLMVSLSSILRNVSNADPRDIFPQRDKKVLIRDRKDVILEFKIAAEKNINYIDKFSSQLNGNHSCKVVNGDARTMNFPDNSIDFTFTSPPYAYAMDYARINQLNTLLLIMPNDKLREHRRFYVGSDRVAQNAYDLSNKNSMDYSGFEFAREGITNLYKEKKRYGICLYKYFLDMREITRQIFRVLKRNAYLTYVIGNSTINKTNFNTAKVFTEICRNIGFKIDLMLERPYYAYRMARKRNSHSNTIKNDIFIIAKKP